MSSTCSLQSMKAAAPKIVAHSALKIVHIPNSLPTIRSTTSLALFKYSKNHSYSQAASVSIIWSKKHVETFSEAFLSQLWLWSMQLWRWHYTFPENWPSNLYTVLHLALV